MSTSSRFVSGGTIAGVGEPTSATTPTPALSSAPAPAAADISPSSATHELPHGNGHKHTTANPSAPVLDATSSTSRSTPASSTRTQSAEWEAAQAALAAERQKREEARRRAVEGDGEGSQSLYEILQANKAAKQAAFEEANRLRNQFRALDDDEIDFLDEVRQREREDEERARRELAAGLDGFRRAQKAGETRMADLPAAEEAEGAADTGNAELGVSDPVGQAEEWTALGRKRKRNKDRDRGLGGLVKGVKRRASESVREVETGDQATASRSSGPGISTSEESQPKPRADPASQNNEVKADTKGEEPPPPPKSAPSFGLVDYGSDDDD